MKKSLYMSLTLLSLLTIVNCGGGDNTTSQLPLTPTSVLSEHKESNITNTLPSENNTSINQPETEIVTQKTSLEKVCNLSTTVNENSGLILIDNQLWTHNDRGDDAKLYQIDKETGKILKTITIDNALNYDWEDITYDENYVYIGDFGNNKGNRKNLKIYKIIRNELQTKQHLQAEIIEFTYGDQTDFTKKSNANNFDAEALISYRDKLYIFSKNWIDQKTRVYELDKNEGTHIAQYQDTLDTQGLVTGASIYNDRLVLVGYSKTLVPKLWILSNFENSNFFSSKVKSLSLNTTHAQIEGVTFSSDFDLLLSSEKFSRSIFNFPATLYTINILSLLD